jgi:hypothetical protein
MLDHKFDATRYASPLAARGTCFPLSTPYCVATAYEPLASSSLRLTEGRPESVRIDIS